MWKTKAPKTVSLKASKGNSADNRNQRKKTGKIANNKKEECHTTTDIKMIKSLL